MYYSYPLPEWKRPGAQYLEGIMRICYYNNTGDEITKYFFDEDHFIADLNSLDLNIPAAEYIQAVTDYQHIALSKSALQELSTTIISVRAFRTPDVRFRTSKPVSARLFT